MKQHNDELNRDNESLRRESEYLRAKHKDRDDIPVLNMGNKQDKFPGEIKDLILATLSDAMRNYPENSRRVHIMKDIIEKNNYQTFCNELSEKLKLALKDFSGMTNSLRRELEILGFDITEEGKHYKLFYYGDHRYFFTLAKTPSDWRAGKNNIPQMTKVLY